MMDSNETVFHKIPDFIQHIGIPIGNYEMPKNIFLLRLLIKNGKLLIDKNQLKYIGDTLHDICIV